MKKQLCIFIVFLAMLMCGITLLYPNMQKVEADIVGTDGAQFILTGYVGNSPMSYFTDSSNSTTLVCAQELTPDKNYKNKNGEEVQKFYYLTGKHTSKTEQTSSGTCAIYPTTEMMKLIGSGQMVVKASAGLLALKDEERCKVNITLQVVAGGEVVKTVTITSDKVSSSSTLYEPDWVETEAVALPTNTEKIIYSFESRGTANRSNAAKFCIFEPTVLFATNLETCTMDTPSQSVKAGQVLQLSASNVVTQDASSSKFFEYYKDIHKITYEITQGGEYAKIVGSYLYVSETVPFGTIIKVRAKCRKSTLNGDYINSDQISLCCDVEQVVIGVDKDFSSPASILGEGKYFVGDYATVSVKENDGFEFVGWEIGGEIVSSEKIYTFKVTKDFKIKAKFKKTIKIKQIAIKTKVFDGTTDAQIENIVLDGVENGHEVVADAKVKFSTKEAGEGKTVEFLASPTLGGKDADIYEIEDYYPSCVGVIAKKELKVFASGNSKTYGENDPNLTFGFEGVIEGDQVLGSLFREQGEVAGKYQITIGDLAEKNPNYNIVFEGAEFLISKREISLQDVGVVSKTYDHNTCAQIFATMSNVVAGDDVRLEFVAEYENANAGTNKNVEVKSISILGEDGKNYFIFDTQFSLRGSITKKQIQVLVKNQTFCYGEQIDIAYWAQGLLGDDELEGKLAISSSHVGSFCVLIGTLRSENYEIVLEAEKIDIVAKPIVVQAKASTKQYGDNDPVLEFETEGLVGDDLLAGSLAREPGEDVGSYAILIGTLHNDNYAITFEKATFDICKRKIELSFDLSNKFYDGTTSIDFTFGVTNVLPKDEVEVLISLSFEDENVGTNKIINVDEIIISGDNSKKYVAIYDKNLLFASIFAKKVKISANSMQKTYGEEDPKPCVEYEGVVEGDVIWEELTRATGEDVRTYSYAPSALMIENNPNYEFCVEQEIYLSIIPKIIDVSFVSKQKQFGESDPEVEIVCDENCLEFDQNMSELKQGEAKREIGEEIGRYSYELGTISFGKNYELNLIGDGKLTIQKRDVEIKANNIQKIYGENDPSFTFVQNDIVAGVYSTIKLKREKGENVGVYAISYESLDDPHYNISFIAGELTIVPCEISVKAEDAFKYYSENDPQIEFVLYSGTLQFNDELASILRGSVSRVTGEDVGEYAINQGTLSAGENYDMTFVGGTLHVFAQELVVKICDKTKYYGEEDPIFDYVVVSGNIADGVFTGKARRGLGEVVGQYAIEGGTLSLTSNYQCRFVEGTLSILPRPIEITALPAVKIYGENDPKFVYEITSGNLVNNDELQGQLYRENVGQKIYENVGRYPMLSSLFNQNYDISYVGADLSIIQREIVVSTSDVSSVYGEQIQTTFDFDLKGDILDGDVLSGGLYKTEGVDVGVYPIRCNINAGRNYKIKYNQAYYEILPRKIIATVGENQKTYSNPDPVFDLQILSGDVVEGDRLEWEIQRQDCEDVGEYDLIINSLNSNYEFETSESVLIILKKDVKLSLELLDKPYDGTAVCKIKNPIVSGLVDNEIMLEYDKNACAIFESIYPADKIQVRLVGFALVGAKANNYNLLLPTQNYACITHSVLESKNVEISTFSSTVMRFGTELDVKSVDVGENFYGKKVVQSMSVGLTDKNGDEIVVDRALDVKIYVQNLNDLNNVIVYGKNSNQEFVKLEHRIEGHNLIISTSTISDFVIVCDDEDWIDIAVAVCVGLILGIALCVIIIDLKKKKCAKR